MKLEHIFDIVLDTKKDCRQIKDLQLLVASTVLPNYLPDCTKISYTLIIDLDNS